MGRRAFGVAAPCVCINSLADYLRYPTLEVNSFENLYTPHMVSKIQQ